jgi:hypothetical protein
MGFDESLQLARKIPVVSKEVLPEKSIGGETASIVSRHVILKATRSADHDPSAEMVSQIVGSLG